MFNPLTPDELKTIIDNAPRIPIAIVVRPDIYEQLITNGEFKFKDAPLGFPGAVQALPDPAVDNIAIRQTEECIMFYDNEALSLYLERGEKPMEWVKYCCEQAGIPCDIPDINQLMPPYIPQTNSNAYRNYLWSL